MNSATYPPAKSSPAGTLRTGAVLAVVCLALAAVVAPMSSLNVALPDIALAIHATQTQLAWIIDAYSLAFASLLLAAGAIGDRYGRRLALIAGLTIFAAGPGVAMTARSASELIGLRAVLGLGAALVMPATLSTITATFAVEQRTRAVSVWAAVAGGAAVLGLLATGILLEVWSWPSVFGLNVVLATAALVGTIRFVPESADPKAPRLDVSGAVLAVIGMAAGSLSIFMQFFALFGFIFIALQYLQFIRGDSGLISALSMLPMSATMLPTSRLAPALMTRLGTRTVSAAGLTLIAAALIVLAQLTSTSSYWLLAAGLILIGAGLGLAMTPATDGITSALPAARQGVASALNDLSRETGGAVGIAIMASILTATYQSHLHVVHLPAAEADKARSSVAVAARLGGVVAAHAQTAFADGMHLALLTAAGIVAAAAIAVATLLRRRDRASDDTPATVPAGQAH